MAEGRERGERGMGGRGTGRKSREEEGKLTKKGRRMKEEGIE